MASLNTIANSNMKYFNTYEELDFEKNSTDYLQIIWGDGQEREYWAKGSLYISGFVFDSLDGMKVFRETGALPDFDFYGDTNVSEEAWKNLRSILTRKGGEYAVLVEELDAWISDGFSKHNCFTILGV